MKDVRAQVDQPQDGVILLDVRRFDEYQTEGKIPTAILFPHTDNFYGDGTFKDTQATRLDYLDEGIKPEDQIIIYCRSGMRAAASFLKLYDSGYTNLKLYDGSYLEWSANPNNPVERPDGAASEAPSSRDAS